MEIHCNVQENSKRFGQSYYEMRGSLPRLYYQLRFSQALTPDPSKNRCDDPGPTGFSEQNSALELD